MIFERRQHS